MLEGLDVGGLGLMNLSVSMAFMTPLFLGTNLPSSRIQERLIRGIPLFGQQNWMEIARLDPHVREPPGRSPMGLVNRSGEEAPDEENGFVDIFNKVLGCRNQRTFGGIDVSTNQ